jgi:ribosome biogenesis GTPase
VTAIETRHNTLARLRAAERAEPLAANLTFIVIVCAPRPAPDFFLLDRFLCAAELMDCDAAIAWNKCDLGAAGADMDVYRELGYPLLEITARTGAGIGALDALLAGRVSILVGQSGVGKSSLVNALVPGEQAATGELSAAKSAGTHTTTAVVMYRLGSGGRLLDAPGVREFVPALGQGSRLADGFADLRALAPGCRFANCEHEHEPGCAVKAAVAGGTLAPRRYESYLGLRGMLGASRRHDPSS